MQIMVVIKAGTFDRCDYCLEQIYKRNNANSMAVTEFSAHIKLDTIYFASLYHEI